MDPAKACKLICENEDLTSSKGTALTYANSQTYEIDFVTALFFVCLVQLFPTMNII